MTLLLVVLTLMAAGAGALAALPLLRGGRAPPPRENHELEVHRDRLREVDRDLESGMIPQEHAEAAKAEIGRRILALDGDRSETADRRPIGRAPLAGAAAAVGVPAIAAAVYLVHGNPDLPARPADPAAVAVEANRPSKDRVSALASELAEDPYDLSRWRALGEILTQFGRHEKAADAYAQAAKIAPSSAEFFSLRGEALTRAANGQVTPQAASAFDEALRRDSGDPRARYYLGVADRQGGRLKKALDRWLALEADLPPDSALLGFLRSQIAALAAEAGVGNDALERMKGRSISKAGPGPTAEDIEAARKLSPEERKAMIRSMVDGLAARLEDAPDDAAGWERLARAYAVLAERKKAKAAFAKASALRPDDVGLLAAWADSIAAEAAPKPPNRDELAPVVEKILALDARNRRGLWLAGALALSTGDEQAAARHWRMLLDLLDPGGRPYADLERQIDMLEKRPGGGSPNFDERTGGAGR